MEPGDALLGPPWFVALGVEWFAALRRKRRRPGTISTYTTPLRSFGIFLDGEGVAEPNLLNRYHVRGWQDSLTLQDTTPKTQSIYATAIRGLLRWGAREGRVPPGLADWVDTVEVPKGEPLVLEPEQLHAVVERYRGRPESRRGVLEWFRDRALFWVLVTSAARINEVLQLDRADAWRSGWTVVQKGGGEKRLVISAMAREWLDQYLAVRGRDDEPALWIYVGPIVGRRRLTRVDANAIWTRLCRELGIDRFTSRWLRGTGATELNELKHTPADIAHHLGHTGLASIMKYVKLRDGRRRDMVDGLDQLIPPPPAPPAPVARRGRRPRA